MATFGESSDKNILKITFLFQKSNLATTEKQTTLFWWYYSVKDDIDGWAQDCSNSIANALELLQSCTKPSISYSLHTQTW